MTDFDKPHSNRCGADETPYCPWWCDVHQVHHPVVGMADWCVEHATTPDPGKMSG